MYHLITLNWNKDIKINIYDGSNGNFYSIEEPVCEDEENITRNEIILNYDCHFPVEWALDNKSYVNEFFESKVGPKYCLNCIEFGYKNGVFIGYCANCAELLDYKRGNGLLPDGNEVCKETFAFDTSDIKEENSIWNTYLKNVSEEKIGDFQIMEDYEMYKDLPPLINPCFTD